MYINAKSYNAMTHQAIGAVHILAATTAQRRMNVNPDAATIRTGQTQTARCDADSITARKREIVMILKFEVMGKPQGKARARTLRNGHSYTPENTVLYENLIKTSFQSQCGLHRFDNIPGSELKQPLSMQIFAVYEIPKSFTKGKRLAAEHNMIRPTTKPDADNIAKVVCDALNGIAYIDDTQVVELEVTKLYGDVPKVTVCMSDIDTSQNKPI